MAGAGERVSGLPRGCVLDSRLKMLGSRWRWLDNTQGGRGCMLERVQAQAGSRCQARDSVGWERMSDSRGRAEGGDLLRGCVLDGTLETVGSRWCWLDGAWSRRGCMCWICKQAHAHVRCHFCIRQFGIS